MSKSRCVALIALVWAVAAFLCALPLLWPPFGRFLDIEQLPLGALGGWIAHGTWVRTRKRKRQV